jgi:hypothetical protein
MSAKSKLSERQMATLRVVANGELVNAGYGNSNVDNRSFYSLLDRGLIAWECEIGVPAKVWITEAGRAALSPSTGD